VSLIPGDLVAPDYGGCCLTGIADSVRGLFGRPARNPLPAGLLPAGGFDCVVQVTLDALGWEQLMAHQAASPVVARVLARGQVSTITSVLPSTTTTALTSLFTGLAPQEHGMLAHSLYLRELGMLVDLLRFHPAMLPGHRGILAGGTEPRAFFAVRPLFTDLAEAGIAAHALMRRELIGTPLSQIHLAGAQATGVVAASDLCVSLRRLVETQPRPLFISAYWDAIDAIAHVHGPGSAEEGAEVSAFFTLFEGEFLDRLGPAARRGTLVLLTADHGQATVEEAQALKLDEHPDLADALLLPPADRRTTYLHVRREALDAVRGILARFPERFHVLETDAALRGGLFGGGTPHPEARVRMGDLVVLSRGRASIVGHEKERPPHPLPGRHGGATPAEMLVPLVAFTL
jgi:hypothetical protein